MQPILNCSRFQPWRGWKVNGNRWYCYISYYLGGAFFYFVLWKLSRNNKHTPGSGAVGAVLNDSCWGDSAGCCKGPWLAGISNLSMINIRSKLRPRPVFCPPSSSHCTHWRKCSRWGKFYILSTSVFPRSNHYRLVCPQQLTQITAARSTFIQL